MKWLCLAISLAAWGCSSQERAPSGFADLAADSAAAKASVSDPAESPAVDSVRRTGKRSDRFPNIELTTQDERKVRFYDDLVKDRLVIVNFMYTRCNGI